MFLKNYKSNINGHTDTTHFDAHCMSSVRRTRATTRECHLECSFTGRERVYTSTLAILKNLKKVLLYALLAQHEHPKSTVSVGVWVRIVANRPVRWCILALENASDRLILA